MWRKVTQTVSEKQVLIEEQLCSETSMRARLHLPALDLSCALMRVQIHLLAPHLAWTLQSCESRIKQLECVPSGKLITLEQREGEREREKAALQFQHQCNMK